MSTLNLLTDPCPNCGKDPTVLMCPKCEGKKRALNAHGRDPLFFFRDFAEVKSDFDVTFEGCIQPKVAPEPADWSARRGPNEDENDEWSSGSARFPPYEPVRI